MRIANSEIGSCNVKCLAWQTETGGRSPGVIRTIVKAVRWPLHFAEKRFRTCNCRNVRLSWNRIDEERILPSRQSK